MIDKKFKVTFNGTEFLLEDTKDGLKIGKQVFNPEVLHSGKHFKIFVAGSEYRVEYKNNAIFLNGKEVSFDFIAAPTIQSKKSSGGARKADIKAAIPGKIVEIKVTEGDIIKDQQCVLVLESMKMRNEILSPIAGEVKNLYVKVDDQVTAHQLLVRIVPQKSNAKNSKQE